MLLGKSNAERSNEVKERLKQMVPHKHFAFIPCKVESGQRAWLQYVYRIGYDFDLKANPKYLYFTTYQAAYNASVLHNCKMSSSYFGDAHKLLIT